MFCSPANGQFSNAFGLNDISGFPGTPTELHSPQRRARVSVRSRRTEIVHKTKPNRMTPLKARAALNPIHSSVRARSRLV